jgi:hypothetical protein
MNIIGLPTQVNRTKIIEVPSVHCNENPIYVFSKKELRGLSPNFHIPVSVGYLYIPRDIFMQQNRQTDRGNI